MSESTNTEVQPVVEADATPVVTEPVSAPAPIEDVQPLSDWDDIPVENVKEYVPNHPEGEIKDGDIEPNEAPDEKAEEKSEEDVSEPVAETSEKSSEAGTEDAPEDGQNNQEIESLDQLLEQNKLDPTKIKVKHKQDGKEVERTLAEVIKDGFGHDTVNKRFTQLAKEKKEFQTQVDSVNAYVNGFREKYNSNGDAGALEAFSYIGELAGAPGYEIKEKLIRALVPEIERRYGLTDTELDMEYRQAQFEYNQKKLDSKEKQIQAQQSNNDLSQKISATRNEHNISEEEWDQAVYSLDNRLDPSEKITVDMVASEVSASRAENSAKSFLQEVDGNLIESKESVDTLKDIILRNPDFTEDDIRSLVQEAYAIPKQKDAAGEKLAKKVATRQVQQSNNNNKAPVEQPDAFLTDIFGL